MNKLFVTFLALCLALCPLAVPSSAQDFELDDSFFSGGQKQEAPERLEPEFQPDGSSAPEGTAVEEEPHTELRDAQEDQAGQMSKTDRIFFALPPDLQDEIMAEVDQVYAQCQRRFTYSRFHDCDCIGALYLEERLLNPDEMKDSILGRLSPECPNTAGMAGYAYENCENIAYDRQDPEGYCRCFANSVARSYTNNPIAHINVYRAYARDAFNECNSRFPRR